MLYRVKGLHRSPGFAQFVSALSAEYKKFGEGLSVALIPEDFAPLYSFSFEDEHEVLQSALSLNDERMAVFEHLVTAGWNHDLIKEAGLDGFFKTALDFQAHIVVLYEEDGV